MKSEICGNGAADELGKYVTLIEVGSKQSYIFASNRLAENIGASIIIRKVTESEPKEFYKSFCPDVIYEGGGRALYVFKTMREGISFARAYSRYVLEQYPGLTIYIVGEQLKSEMTVKEGIDRCYALMEEKKRTGSRVRMIDFGGTLRCAETNLPAVPYKDDVLPEDRRNRPISAESLKKYECRMEQEEYFQDIRPEGWKFPLRMEDLGRSRGEKSYIAVVHIDGNRMRDKISGFDRMMVRKTGETKGEFDDRYVEALRTLSEEIDGKYKEAFLEMNQTLTEHMEKLKQELEIPEGKVLPVRPLILAGDDVCYVTDGRIGVETARIFLEKIRRKSVQGISMNACAGVAIVKVSFPFSRAYALAEELCRNAKAEILEGQDASLLDWHVDQGELRNSLKEIRRQYVAEDGCSLTMKPYRMTAEWEEDSFRHFEHALEILREPGMPRSKILGMREAVRKGKKAAEYYLESNRLAEELGRTQWKRGEYGFSLYRGRETSLFFDAMEMLDLYIGLEGATE